MRFVWIGLSVIALIVLIVSGAFAWQLRLVYHSWVASTSKGEPLFERALLEHYGDAIVKDLIEQDVKLAIISRSGQARDKLPPGVMYTHSAFWLRGTGPDGSHVYRVYNLYHGEENRLISSLVVDDPADFLRLTREHDVGIIIPNRATQDALYTHIKSPAYSAVHQVNYSLISNPYDVRYQNCNEFMLDTMAAHFWNISDPQTIKQGYRGVLSPTELEASWVRRMFGPMIDERLIMDDHDDAILTTTRQTLSNFLQSENRLERAYVLDLESDSQDSESN